MRSLRKDAHDEMRRRRLAHTAGRRAFRAARKRKDGSEAQIMADFASQGIDISSNIHNYDKTKDKIALDKRRLRAEIAKKKEIANKNKAGNEDKAKGVDAKDVSADKNVFIDEGGNKVSKRKDKTTKITNVTTATEKANSGVGEVGDDGVPESIRRPDANKVFNKQSSGLGYVSNIASKEKAKQTQLDRDNAIRERNGLGTVAEAEEAMQDEYKKTPEYKAKKLAEYEARDAKLAEGKAAYARDPENNPFVESYSDILMRKSKEARELLEKTDFVDGDGLDRAEAIVSDYKSGADESAVKKEDTASSSLDAFNKARGDLSTSNQQRSHVGKNIRHRDSELAKSKSELSRLNEQFKSARVLEREKLSPLISELEDRVSDLESDLESDWKSYDQYGKDIELNQKTLNSAFQANQSSLTNPFAMPPSKHVKQLQEPNDKRTGFRPMISPLSKFKPLFTS